MSAVASHRPDVVVGQYRRVVDDDLFPRRDRGRRKEKELVVDLANAGVGFTRVIQVPAERVTGIEIRLRPKAEAIVGERAASFPENISIDDAAGDLDDRLIAPVRTRGEESEAVAGASDNDGAMDRWNGGTSVRGRGDARSNDDAFACSGATLQLHHSTASARRHRPIGIDERHQTRNF